MYSTSRLAINYLRHWFTAASGKGHGIHSPFVFDFVTRVLNDRRPYPEYARVDALRARLLQDPSRLDVEDFGAGSAIHRSARRPVSGIARHAAKSRKYGELLFRMARYYQPETILELGTSLGISTAYLSLACPRASVTTIEGSPAIAARAETHFRELGLTRTRLVRGNFDEVLPGVLAGLPAIGLAFLDGNHRYEPTLHYVDRILARSGPSTILLLDDIHWSADMERAWDACRKRREVTLSIDLFFVGILLMRPELREKLHFRIRF
ncbi:MAG TPA: class I SAM-dependent methyltransferase [Chitinophagaceae bacterium]|nr:class I SAM-dependent methyltransferase [Chitinophagaceae bacterium]